MKIAFVDASSKRKFNAVSLHDAREIWKGSFISTVRPTVHTYPSLNRSFSKTLFKPEDLETPAFRFRVGGKH